MSSLGFPGAVDTTAAASFDPLSPGTLQVPAGFDGYVIETGNQAVGFIFLVFGTEVALYAGARNSILPQADFTLTHTKEQPSKPSLPTGEVPRVGLILDGGSVAGFCYPEGGSLKYSIDRLRYPNGTGNRQMTIQPYPNCVVRSCVPTTTGGPPEAVATNHQAYWEVATPVCADSSVGSTDSRIALISETNSGVYHW